MNIQDQTIIDIIRCLNGKHTIEDEDDIKLRNKLVSRISNTFPHILKNNTLIENGEEHPNIKKFWYAFIEFIRPNIHRGDYPTVENLKDLDNRNKLALLFLEDLDEFIKDEDRFIKILKVMLVDKFNIYYNPTVATKKKNKPAPVNNPDNFPTLPSTASWGKRSSSPTPTPTPTMTKQEALRLAKYFADLAETLE